jgi:hypothetical protein
MWSAILKHTFKGLFITHSLTRNLIHFTWRNTACQWNWSFKMVSKALKRCIEFERKSDFSAVLINSILSADILLISNVQESNEASVFLQFRVILRPQNSAKITQCFCCILYIICSTFLHLPWLPSFEPSVYLAILSMPTLHKVLHFTIFFNALGKILP